MSAYPERRRNASPCWYWLAKSGWRTSNCSSQFRHQSNLQYIWTYESSHSMHCLYTIIGWTATLHLPGSVKESKHVFKVNISKPKNDLYPQFREWRDTESFTYNYNDAWRQSSIMHLGTMAEKVRPEKALLERLKWTKTVHAQSGKRHILFIRPIVIDDGVTRAAEVKSNSGTMIRQVAKIASLKRMLHGKWCISVPEDGNNVSPFKSNPI